MGKRAAVETVTAIVAAFWKQRRGPKRSWAGSWGWRRGRCASIWRSWCELVRAGWPLDKDEDHPHVFWSVPKSWFLDGVLLGQSDVAALLQILLRVPDGTERRRLLGVTGQ